MVTGVRTQGKLKPPINEVRIFATRFNPEESEADLKTYVSDLIGDDCSVKKIQLRTNRHSSFVVTTKKHYEHILLDPNSWEEGIQVRYFYGQPGNSMRNETVPSLKRS